MIPSLINRNSSRAWQPLSLVNVTGLLRRLQVKIENIYLFKILIKKHENVFESWLCPNFLLVPKKSDLPKIWGGCSPPRPPRPVRLWRHYACSDCLDPKTAGKVTDFFASEPQLTYTTHTLVNSAHSSPAHPTTPPTILACVQTPPPYLYIGYLWKTKSTP